MKKKHLIILSIAVVVLGVFLLIFCMTQSTITMDGRILFKGSDNNLYVYECSEKKTTGIPLKREAVFWGNNKLLFADKKVYEYDLNTGEENILYESDVIIDYIAVRNNESFSFSKGNLIYWHDTQTNESKAYIWDNGSEIHSWSDDGNILYYSDTNRKIKAVDINTEEVTEIAQGFSPVVSGHSIAYEDINGDLIVKNMQTATEYKYSGSPRDYTFSPSGDILLVEEQNISFGTMAKNIMTGNFNILGGCVLAWDYERNQKEVVLTDAYCDIYDWIK